jgi:hypothetical protein
MATFVALLGTLTVLLCAVLLTRGYVVNRQRLLLWSALCFYGLALTNALLVVDLLIPETDFHEWRLGAAALAMALLVYGLVWESDRS